jgi:enoyl-CoA hydratase/carnithine racemase
MQYAEYQHLRFDLRPNGVMLLTLDRPPVNATDARMHWELTEVWKTIDADPAVRIVLVTGAGKAFSAGGDMSLLEGMAGDAAAVSRTLREAADIVYNMINLEKPIISAINGVAVGAGLAVALMADISIIADTARLTDGHLRLGVGAGDHAAIIWPLLCGMAKANTTRSPPSSSTAASRVHRPGEPVRASGAKLDDKAWESPTASPRDRRTRCASPSAPSTAGCASPARSSTRRSPTRC